MKLTKEELSARIEEILNDKENNTILVNKLLESGLFDDVLQSKGEEELVYDCNYYISNCLDIKQEVENTKYDITIFTHHKTPFYFSSKETAELWARKLSALNKLRMIKELIDDKDIDNSTTDSVFIIVHHKDSNSYDIDWIIPNYYEIKSPSFNIKFNSKEKCARAIELMGKEALDDLFIEIN